MMTLSADACQRWWDMGRVESLLEGLWEDVA